MVGCCGLALLLRAPSLLQSVIDWDESIYALVAKGWLQGHWPYVDIWDHKPIGTYALFSLAMLLGGQNILAVRLLGLFAVSATAFLLFQLTRRLSHHQTLPGILAATLFLVYVGENNGLATNTEILFLPFTTGAFYWLYQHANRLPQLGRLPFLGAGLLLGLAFQIKYVAVYESLAWLLGCLLFWFASNESNVRRVSSTVRLIQQFVFFAGGFLLPTALVWLIYTLNHHWPAYAQANYTANTRYAFDQHFQLAYFKERLFWFYRTNQPILLGSLISSICLLFPANRPHWRTALSLCIWLFSVILGITFTLLRYYDHYFIPLLVPLCLILGLGICNLAQQVHVRRPMLLLACLIWLYPPISTLLQTHATFYQPLWHGQNPYSHWKSSFGALAPTETPSKPHVPPAALEDEPRYVAQRIQAQLAPGESIFVLEHPVIYFLTTAHLPSRYVHPLYFIEPECIYFTGLNPQQEFQKIQDARPAYLVLRTAFLKQYKQAPFLIQLRQWIHRDYTLMEDLPTMQLFKSHFHG